MKEKKILLIDDDFEQLAAIATRLTMEGWSVTTTSTPRKALPLARELQPDLVICDVEMDDLTGPEVASQLGSDPVTREIPFVFLTVHVSPRQVTDDGTADGIWMISKQSGLDEVSRRVREFFETI